MRIRWHAQGPPAALPGGTGNGICILAGWWQGSHLCEVVVSGVRRAHPGSKPVCPPDAKIRLHWDSLSIVIIIIAIVDAVLPLAAVCVGPADRRGQGTEHKAQSTEHRRSTEHRAQR